MMKRVAERVLVWTVGYTIAATAVLLLVAVVVPLLPGFYPTSATIVWPEPMPAAAVYLGAVPHPCMPDGARLKLGITVNRLSTCSACGVLSDGNGLWVWNVPEMLGANGWDAIGQGIFVYTDTAPITCRGTGFFHPTGMTRQTTQFEVGDAFGGSSFSGTAHGRLQFISAVVPVCAAVMLCVPVFLLFVRYLATWRSRRSSRTPRVPAAENERSEFRKPSWLPRLLSFFLRFVTISCIFLAALLLLCSHFRDIWTEDLWCVGPEKSVGADLNDGQLNFWCVDTVNTAALPLDSREFFYGHGQHWEQQRSSPRHFIGCPIYRIEAGYWQEETQRFVTPLTPIGSVLIVPNKVALAVLLTAAALGAISLFITHWHPAMRPGHCAQCGYDLRASVDRCPECGALNPAAKTGTQKRRKVKGDITLIDRGDLAG